MLFRDISYDDWIETIQVFRQIEDFLCWDPWFKTAVHIVHSDHGTFIRDDKYRPYPREYFDKKASFLEVLIRRGVSREEVYKKLVRLSQRTPTMGRIRWRTENEYPEVTLKGVISRKNSFGIAEKCRIDLDSDIVEDQPYHLEIENAGPFFDLEEGDEVEIVVRLKNPRGPDDHELPRQNIREQS